MPKCSTVTGADTSSTARDAATTETAPFRRLCSPSPRACSIAAVIGSASRIIPAIAEKDICRLTLAQLNGFSSRISANAAPSAVGPSFSRRKTGARSSTVCIVPARTAEGEAPVIKTKNHTSRIPVTEDAGLAPNSSWIIPTRKATCIPDTATICMNPAPRMDAYSGMSR